MFIFYLIYKFNKKIPSGVYEYNLSISYCEES